MFELGKYLTSISPKAIMHEMIPNNSFYKTYRTYECNINPLSYFSSVVDTISMMIIKFQMDYIETISIL